MYYPVFRDHDVHSCKKCKHEKTQEGSNCMSGSTGRSKVHGAVVLFWKAVQTRAAGGSIAISCASYEPHWFNHSTHRKECIPKLQEINILNKNPAYGRHQLSRPMRIVGPIQI